MTSPATSGTRSPTRATSLPERTEAPKVTSASGKKASPVADAEYPSTSPKNGERSNSCP